MTLSMQNTKRAFSVDSEIAFTVLVKSKLPEVHTRKTFHQIQLELSGQRQMPSELILHFHDVLTKKNTYKHCVRNAFDKYQLYFI